MMRLLKRLQQSQSYWFLFITSVIFTFFRLPSLFEPYWYGDEGIYEVIGYGLRHGRLLYSGIWDNKPPLLYLMFALFDGDQTGARFLSLLAGLGAVWGFFFLSKKLFVKQIATFVSTGLFAFLFAIPLIEGNIANAENFMLVFGILTGSIMLSLTKKKNRRELSWLFIAGLLVGISFLYKVVGMFDMASFAVFLFIMTLEKYTIVESIYAAKRLVPYVLGFVAPILLCCLFFLLTGTFSTFIHSVLFSNVGYVNYGNQFIIPQGFLILKTLLLSALAIFLLFQRHRFSPTKLFILLWVSFDLYSALFSQRPYTHYVLVLLPSFALLVGLVIEETKQKLLYGLVTLGIFLFVLHSFSFSNKSFSYYANFLSYVVGSKSPTAYQAYFDRVTPRDYQIAQFITSQKGKATLFVWGNSGQIYQLAHTLPPGRFIVAYHVTMTPANYNETAQLLAKNPPQFLIVLPKQDIPPLSLAHYKELFIIQDATVYEHTF